MIKMAKKKLQEIFWGGDEFTRGFKNSNGEWVGVRPLCEPISIVLGVDNAENNKKIEHYVNKVLPYKYLEIDAYLKGTPSNNERGFPIQFYKIEFK